MSEKLAARQISKPRNLYGYSGDDGYELVFVEPSDTNWTIRLSMQANASNEDTLALIDELRAWVAEKIQQAS